MLLGTQNDANSPQKKKINKKSPVTSSNEDINNAPTI